MDRIAYFQINLHVRMAMPDSQRFRPFKLFLIKNVENIVVFLGLKVLKFNNN